MEKLRTDVAAFGKDDGDAPEAELKLQRHANEAIARAGGALEFMSNREEPAARELQRLYDAIAPLLAEDA